MIRSIFAKCWWMFAVVTIMLAVLMTIFRLLLPTVGDYRDEIEQWLSVSIGQPVQFGRLETEWHGFGPRLNIHEVNIFDKQHDRLLISFNEASIGLDLIASLLNGQVEFGDLTVIGANLSVIRLQDGSITVQGLSLKRKQASPGKENDRLLRWLFSQDNIAIEASEIVWQDLINNNLYEFSNVNLDLRNEGSRHQFDGSAALPASMGRRISFAIDLKGDPQVPDGWSGRGYVNGGGLHLDTLLKDQEIAGIHVENGVAEIRLWSEWKNARLVKLEGMLSSFGIGILPVELTTTDNGDENQHDPARVPDSFKADTLSGRFVWQKQGNGALMAINDFVLSRDGRLWPFSNLNLRISGQADTHRIEAQASYLHMADIRDMLLISDLPDSKLRKALVTMQPSGDVYDTYVDFQRSENNDEIINFASRFENLAVESWKKFPAVRGLAGNVKGNQQSGSIEFSTSSAQVELSPMFRDPILISELDGTLAWQYHQEYTRLSGDELVLKNDDLQMLAKMDIEIPADGTAAPFLNFDVNFSGSPDSVAHTSRYLPVTVIPKTSEWLDRSIIGGTISGGKFLFNGRVDQFPFNHDEGQFEVRFNLANGILDYVEGWPRLEEIDAEVRFVGSRMEINAVAGKSLDSEISQVHARIADLKAKPAVLEIQGKAHGPTQDVLRYINESPLSGKFGHYIKDVSATGESRLDLGLIKPLTEAPAQVSGVLTFEDSTLLLANDRVDMTNINGNLEFTESSVVAQNMSVKLLGLESVVDIRTQQEQQATTTYITANGEADGDSIVKLLEMPSLKGLSGKTQWTAWLRIPKISGDEHVVSNLHIESNLHGLAIDLPEPFKKNTDETLNLAIDTGLPRSLDKLIEVSLGDILTANLDVNDDMHIERGEIHLGKGIAPFPERDGLHISGKWPQLSLDEWLPLIKSKKMPGDSPGAVIVKDVDIDVENMKAFERQYHKVKLQAERMPEMWRVAVNSSELKGIIHLPVDPEASLIMELDYLHLAKLENKKAGDQIDPRNIPVMRINSKVFTYDDMDFGSLDLIASRHPAGIHLDSLKLVSPTNNVDARGDWVSVNGEHYSSFNISFNSRNLGDTLAKWGYAGSIKNGNGTFDIIARWPGPPTTFALERLDGNLHLKITDGRLLEIDPGAGRIFGLISLQALPRRLSLDFSDIFKKGFSFDRIEGDFVLERGNAQTENLVMDGPAARIEAQGRVGLGARDYDQVVTLNPNVSSSLPVAGAVVGGLGVGAAMLLAQKLLEPEIDKATRIKYSVTGLWENPVIKRINVEQPAIDNVKGQNK